MKILIIGNGFLGSRCAAEWPDAVLSDKIINTVADAADLLDEHRPDAVLNAAGIVGKPNVDWCETNQRATIIGNTVLPLLIAEACQEKNIYLLHMGTGCVFYGDGPWKEEDHANPSAVYTRTKYAADLALSTLPNVGVARIRMPIDHIPSKGNLIDKLASYKRVIDVENSVTVIEDMIKAFRHMLENRLEGIYHVTNPGTIKHREILAMYKEIVNPGHENEWITEEDLVNEGLALRKRSNNFLQTDKLARTGFAMRPVQEAVRDTLEKYARIKLAEKQAQTEQAGSGGSC